MGGKGKSTHSYAPPFALVFVRHVDGATSEGFAVNFSGIFAKSKRSTQQKGISLCFIDDGA